MELSLPADVAEFVSAKVASGEFSSADEVAIAAIRRFRDAESAELAELRAALAMADEQLDRGEYIELPDPAARRSYFEGLKRAKRP